MSTGAGGETLVSVRPMVGADLEMVGAWLHEPHVAQWWTDPAGEFTSIRARVLDGTDPATRMLTVSAEGRAVGWAQWYRWDDYPDEAEAMGAQPGEIGMDYAIGDPSATGRGLGRQMIASLIRHLRRHEPGAGLLVGPEAANMASRAVLARNGFSLVAVCQVATEPTDDPIAIYRLEAPPVRLATADDAETIGQLLDQFNREFAEPSPGREALASRIAALIEGGETAIVLGGTGPDGLAVLRFRLSIWTEGSECDLAELYVTPAKRSSGLGRAIMRSILDLARERGADWMSIDVHEPDVAARTLYESLGFTNRDGDPDGPVIYAYQLDLTR